MAYEVLARKWRPTTFDAMVGQEHVLRALANALASNRLHHAYLFTGTRGVGKTTVARILARCLNCETGVTATPCGSCSSCVEIGEGRFVDLIEVDAASRSRVEETRDLMENVQYAPTRGRFKVYLIDEVHMLSTASFNALLKTLEEPPPHVKFLLATTDPKKLPVTVLSRCLQFHLKNLTPERIVGHLQDVLDQEAVPAESDALWALARAADGSMRDALSLTDQAIAFGNGQLIGADVARMLGTIDQSALERILRALAAGDGEALLACSQDLATHGADFAAVLRDLMSALHRIAVAQALPGVASGPAGDGDRLAALCAELSGLMAPEAVQLCYQIALTGHRDLPHAPDPMTGFEMTLLRMLAFQPDEPGTPVAGGDGGTAADASPAATRQREPAPAGASSDGQQGAAAVPADRAAVPPGASMAASEAPAGQHLGALRAVTDDPSTTAETWVSPSPQDEAMMSPQGDNVEQLDQWRTRVGSRDDGALQVPPESIESMPEADPRLAPDNELPRFDQDGAPSSLAPDQPDPESGWRIGDDACWSDASPTELPQQAGGPASDARPPAEDAPAATAEIRAAGPQGLPEHWHAVLAQLDLSGLTATLATHCQPDRVLAGRVCMLLDPTAEALHADMHCARLEAALSAFYGQALQVEITVAAPDAETPAQRAAREKAERQAAAEAAIQADATVRSLMETFNAQMQPGSVRPRG